MEANHPICGANSRTTGKPCQNYPVRGRKRCRMHGGKALAGIAHPNWQGGGKPHLLVDALPERLREVGQAAQGDVELGELRGQMAVLHARQVDLLQNLDDHAAGQIWSWLKEAVQERDRFKVGTPDWEAQDRRVVNLIDDGLKEQSTWEEMRFTSDLQRKLSDSEHRRLERLRALIPAEKVLTAIDAILAAVRAEVDDPQALNRISLKAFAVMNFTSKD